jgi:hypothetical protein
MMIVMVQDVVLTRYRMLLRDASSFIIIERLSFCERENELAMDGRQDGAVYEY